MNRKLRGRVIDPPYFPISISDVRLQKKKKKKKIYILRNYTPDIERDINKFIGVYTREYLSPRHAKFKTTPRRNINDGGAINFQSFSRGDRSRSSHVPNR